MIQNVTQLSQILKRWIYTNYDQNGPKKLKNWVSRFSNFWSAAPIRPLCIILFCNRTLRNNFIFTYALDNLCDNSLNLSNGKLIVESNLPFGTYCKWLISAVDDKHYVIMEFDNLEVRIAELNYLPWLILYLYFYLDQILA